MYKKKVEITPGVCDLGFLEITFQLADEMTKEKTLGPLFNLPPRVVTLETENNALRL